MLSLKKYMNSTTEIRQVYKIPRGTCVPAVRTDKEFHILTSNCAAARLFGTHIEEMKGINLFSAAEFLRMEDGSPLFPHDIRQHTGRIHFDDIILRNTHGAEFYVRLDCTEYAEIFAFTFTHIPDISKITDKLAFQETHDLLTGLYNRNELSRRIVRALEMIRTQHRQYAFLRIDIDRFKMINDAYGTAAGNSCLQQAASVLTRHFPENACIARAGSDDFVVIMEDADAGAAVSSCEILLDTLKNGPFIFGNEIFPVSASIGIVIPDEKFVDEIEIMIALNETCARAGKKGGGRFSLYCADDSTVKRRNMPAVLKKINNALKNDGFILYYQEIKPLGKDSRPKIEVLLRMKGSKTEIIEPAEFLPAAEQYKLQTDIDRWVVRKAAQIRMELNSEKGPLSQAVFCINLSGATVQDDTFVPFLLETVDTYQVAPEDFCFEITETTAITNLHFVSRLISILKEKGFEFALDDFGSGFSSFNYLKMLPVNYLKIDGSFVRDMDKNSINKTMVEAINSMCHVLGLETVGEYAQNTAIIEMLAEIGVDFAQGYAISAPCPLRTEQSE